jgi:predicted MFS family arabinose efflux permease
LNASGLAEQPIPGVIYLVERGFSALAVGTIVTGTPVGTALMTLWVGWIANRYSRRLLLLTAAVLIVRHRGGLKEG